MTDLNPERSAALAVSPASGELRAVRGYLWQFDHAAALAYDALWRDTLVSVRLVNRDAGKVDDLVLVTHNGVDAYQFKNAGSDGFLTFRQLLARRTTRSGGPAPSLIRSLAEGWAELRLRHRGEPVRVHLVDRLFASVSDHLSGPARQVSPDHFRAFIDQVLDPLRQGTLSMTEVAAGWEPALARLRAEAGLQAAEFPLFLRSLHLDLGARDAVPAAGSGRGEDIRALSEALLRAVGEASDAAKVHLSRHQVLDLMGWASRPRMRSRHVFPVDLDTYSPLEGAIAELDGQLSQRVSGYIAVTGAPGSGKSTLLAQGLTGRPERIVRYYVHVPGAAPAVTRLTARNFLHDLVVSLDQAGLGTAELQLPSRDREGLRSELHERLDAAGREFNQSARRTLIVIDGLDHAEREYGGPDGLLTELPAPSELPGGVVIITGSRTLSPLHPRTRQWAEDERAVVSLDRHRLPPSAVLEVCRRAPVTSGLGKGVHERVAQLSAGHPLALGYLLRRLEGCGEADDPLEVLSAAPAYSGDIAQEYRVIWAKIEASQELESLLAVCSRLRTGFTSLWLESWAPAAATEFRRGLLYLFRQRHDGLHFFHDSFRQFCADRTALGDDGRFDAARDAVHHAQAARLCATADGHLKWEELYHRHCAGQHDAVVALARQDLFREQAHGLRPLERISRDIGLALRACAARCDVPGMLAMILASRELAIRADAFQEVDFPGALYEAGLVEQAIMACGGGVSAQVPLAYAYRLAERLARAGKPEGRQIFDQSDRGPFDDSPQPLRAPRAADETASAWGAAAPWFRPPGTILAAAAALLVPDNRTSNDDDVLRERPSYYLHATIMRAVIATLAAQEHEDDLMAVDKSLAASLHAVTQQQLPDAPSPGSAFEETYGEPDERAGQAASLTDLRVHVRLALSAMNPDPGYLQGLADEAISLVRDATHYQQSTILDVAELAARHDRAAAAEMTSELPYARTLSVDDLMLTGEPGILNRQFRYWRLRFALADERLRPVRAAGQPTSTIITLKGTFSMHSDTEAIALASEFDSAIRALARLDAAITSATAPGTAEAWATVQAALEAARPRPQDSSSLGCLTIIWQQHEALLLIAASVAAAYGQGLPQRLAEELAPRAGDHLPDWPLRTRQSVAAELGRAGLTVGWLPSVLTQLEHQANQDSGASRLSTLASLVQDHAQAGCKEQAARVASSLVPAAFGIGIGRESHLGVWAEWLIRALRETPAAPVAADATTMARLLAAAHDVAHSEPADAASSLPAALALASPAAAVHLSEFLIRQGAAREADCLTQLFDALAALQDPHHSRQPSASSNATLTAPGSEGAHADATAIPPEASPLYDHGSLSLGDGRSITWSDVLAIPLDTATVIALRKSETADSSLDWPSLIRRLPRPSATEVAALEEAFPPDSRDGAEVLTVLAEQARDDGDMAQAARLADIVLRDAPRNWSSWYRGAARRRAHAVAIAAGGQQHRLAACQEIAEHALYNRQWLSHAPAELNDLIRELDPSITASASWPIIRRYLDGLFEALALPRDYKLEDLASRRQPGQSCPEPNASSPAATAAALAELAVRHLNHPSIDVRDRAHAAITRARPAGSPDAADALPTAPND